MKRVASVAVSNSTRQYDKEYHYIIPEGMEELVVPGIRVIVPFGRTNSSREAYVLGMPDDAAMEGLKEIKKVIDDTPVLDEKQLHLAKFMKEKYICTYSDAVKCMLPAGIGMKSLRIIKLLKGSEDLKGNEKRIADSLEEEGRECEYDQLKEKVQIKSFSKYIRSLEDKSCISIFEEFTPRVREKTVRVAFLAMPQEEAAEIIESNRIKKIQHIRVLEMLMENRYISVADIKRYAGISASVLDTLKKYGYIDFKDIEVKRDPMENRYVDATVPLTPTAQQAIALERLTACVERTEFDEVLLHGVTGSGKTEVYLQLIGKIIDIDKQAIVLVPEISLTPQMVERFKGRFGKSVAVLHSRLSLGERYDQWRLIREGKIKVAVGARSAVFAPFKKLGAIIIDEEQENTYKSEVTPKYHAAVIARERCRLDGALLLLGSATPSVDTYYRAKKEEIGLIRLTERANNALLPRVEIVDLRNELEEGNRSIFSRKLSNEIEGNIKSGQQTMLFLNRRGYSSFVLCRSCGFAIKCPNCNITLTYHSSDDRLICHYCGFTVRMPGNCPRCKSTYIKQFGTGTQKVEEELKKQFDGCSVIRMDADTTTGKNSHYEILKAFKEKNINIMVGTQMIAKGHDFSNVTLVGVLAADSLLNMDDFRAAEKTFQLITQVAGRAGRGEIPGRVVIQTYNTEDFSINAAREQNYTSFYNQEIRIREKLEYPPFTNIATVILSGTDDRLTFSKAKTVKQEFVSGFSDFADRYDVLGPSRPPLSRLKNRYRWRIVIKCKDIDKIINVLRSVSDWFNSTRKKANVELSVDINPFSML
jgi:primosomal protein N' (replication factor Y)